MDNMDNFPQRACYSKSYIKSVSILSRDKYIQSGTCLLLIEMYLWYNFHYDMLIIAKVETD